MSLLGFFGKAMGKKVKQALQGDTPEATKGPDSANGDAPGIPEQPTSGVEQPAPRETPLPTRDQTGAPARQISQDTIDESIDEVGAAGVVGEVEGASLEGRQGVRNINLSFFEDDQTRRTIDFFNRKMDGGEDLPARRVVTHKETISKSTASDDEGTRRAALERVLNTSIDEKWQPEDLVSIYNMLEVQGTELRDAAVNLKAQRTAGITPSTEDMAHYQLLSTRFVAIQEIAASRASEAGRMLNALQAVSKTSGRQYFEDLKNIVQSAGGENTLWQNIDTVSSATDLADIVNKAKQTWGQKAWNTALQVRYNMMLSSFRTHAANIIGSVYAGGFEALVTNPVRIGTSQLDGGVRAMVNFTFGDGTVRVADRIALSEMVTVPMNIITSVRAAMGHAKAVFRGDAMGHGKMYNEMGVRRSDANLMGGGALPKWAQMPTRMLEAEDAFFRGTYSNAMIKTLAKRKAILDGGTPAEIDAAYLRHVKNPSDEMVNEAQDFASKYTFTNDPSMYGSFMATIAKAMAEVQKNPMGRMVFPFVRTPINLVGHTMEQTGLNTLSAPIKLFNDLKDPKTAPDAEARLLIAAGMFVYLKSYWDEGKLTGAAPENYGVYRAREAAGWKPNSLRVGDEYLELNRLDPFGLTLATYATVYDAMAHMTEEDLSTASAAGIVTVASMITDRSMLSGLGDIERVFKSSSGSVGKQAGKFGARILTSFIVPNIIRDAREMADPYKRSIDVPAGLGGAMYEAVRKTVFNAVPGLSGKIPPRIDAFGNDMISVGGALYRGLVPIRRAQIKQDPVTAALIGTATPMNKPSNLIKLPIAGAPEVDLLEVDDGAGWVYRMYQQDVGKARYSAIKKLTSSSQWQRAIDKGLVGPDTEMANLLSTIISSARRNATLKFLDKLSGMKSITPTVAGEKTGDKIELTHVFDKAEYAELIRVLRRGGPTPENLKRVTDAGLKYRHTPAQQGLADEFKLQESGNMPRF